MLIVAFLLALFLPVPLHADSFCLTWTDTIAEDFYEIERQIDTGGYLIIAQVGGTVSSYEDANVQNGPVYCYRIRGSLAGIYSPYGNITCDAYPVPGSPAAPSALIVN